MKFYFTISDPEIFDELRSAIEKHIDDSGFYSVSTKLENLKYEKKYEKTQSESKVV